MSANTLIELMVEVAQRSEVGLEILDRREVASWHAWSSIVERAARVAGGLRARGVAAGDRVALILPTGADFVHGFFGVVWAGAVPVPLYPPLRLGCLDEYREQTESMLRTAGANLVLSDRRISSLLQDALRRANVHRGWETVGGLMGASTEATRAAPSDLALVQYSSGTTLRPKAVALEHRAILAQLDGLRRIWPTPRGAEHRGVSWLPLYHDMGLIGALLAALHHPGSLTLIPPELFVARPAVWLRAIARTRATISPAPDFAYALCCDRIQDEELDGVDLSCWQIALTGGEMVSARTLRRFAERFANWGFDPIALSPVYGLAEATLAVSFSSLDRPWQSRHFDRERLGRDGLALDSDGGLELVSVGRPLLGFDLRIADADGSSLPERRVGRIFVRGPSMLREYLDDAEATAALRVGEWLDTGDLGVRIDEELYVTGRAKDILIHRGRNLAPEELERVADRVDGARPGCVAAVSSYSAALGREQIVLLVERRRKLGPSANAAIAARCREQLLASCGVEVDLVQMLEAGTLPRTSSGKIRRAEARRRLLAHQLRPPGRVWQQLIKAWLRR